MSIDRFDPGCEDMFLDETGRFVLHSDHVARMADLRRHNERMQQALQVLIDHGVTCLHCDDPAIDLDLQDILENV